MNYTGTNTINYAGALFTKGDPSTRFLDAVTERGKQAGGAFPDVVGTGRTSKQSTEFITASFDEIEDPTQPNISEDAAMEAPPAVTTDREQESNVIQIFQEKISVSFLKQSDSQALGGVNLAGAENNTPSEFDYQANKRRLKIRRDLNHTMLNGIYQFVRGSTSTAPRSRGVLTAIDSNRIDEGNAEFTDKMLDDAIREAIKNGCEPSELEIWVNNAMLRTLSKFYISLPSRTSETPRNEGGFAVRQIMTEYGDISVNWDSMIPDNKIALINMSQMSVQEKPYVDDETGEVYESVVIMPLARRGASKDAQLYAQLGCNYGGEQKHIIIENVAKIV
jgi:hypothetical protein